MMQSFITIFGSIYFWKISKHAIYFEIVGLIWEFLSCILMFWIPESPRYLMESGQLDKANAVFDYIAKWNKKELIWDPCRFNMPNTSKVKEA